MGETRLYVHQLGFETAISVGGGRASRITIPADLAFHGPKNLNTTGTIRSDTYERATGASPMPTKPATGLFGSRALPRIALR